MLGRLIVIRPQPGCESTVSAARELGLEAHGFPLFEVRPLEWQAPTPDSFDALLIGSANALRHGGAVLQAYRGMPAYAVGQTSADAASAAGLDVVVCGDGGLQALLGQLHPDHRRLLRLSGRDHVELTPPPGVMFIERLVYASEPQPMSAPLAGLLRQPVIVLLHSAEAARHFASQCDKHAVARSQIHLATLGPRIAEAVGQGWGSRAAATAPNDKALLALALQMCQSIPIPTGENRA